MEINKDAYVQVKQKAADLLASNNEKDKEAGRYLVKRIAEGENITYKEALKQVINLKWSQYKTREDRGYTNKKGQLSTIPQARNLRDLMEYGEP